MCYMFQVRSLADEMGNIDGDIALAEVCDIVIILYFSGFLGDAQW